MVVIYSVEFRKDLVALDSVGGPYRLFYVAVYPRLHVIILKRTVINVLGPALLGFPLKPICAKINIIHYQFINSFISSKIIHEILFGLLFIQQRICLIKIFWVFNFSSFVDEHVL